MTQQVARIENLPKLIEQAANTLAQATNYAQVLDAHKKATVAYDAAKLAARLADKKDAYDKIIAACRKVQADALVIAAQAEIRLADEYDAAKARGEVAGHGGGRNFKRDNAPLEKTKLADIGLTPKQMSDARAVRDAEKADPGVVERTVRKRISEGHEPTKAAVKQAVKATNTHKPVERKRASVERKRSTPEPDKKQEPNVATTSVNNRMNIDLTVWARFVELAKKLNTNAADLSGRIVTEFTDKGEPEIDATTLSMSAQQKLETAIRQHKRKLDESFAEAVRLALVAERDQFLGDTIKRLQERERHANAVLHNNAGIMPRSEFRLILAALSPDSRRNFSDERIAAAFNAFKQYEPILVARAKDDPLPTITPADLTAMRAAAEAARKAKRKSSAEAKANKANGSSVSVS